MKRLILLLILLCSSLAGYQKPTGFSDETWAELSPYFLPEDHPAKSSLDRIFTSSRVLIDAQSAKNVGLILSKQRPSGMYVASHKHLKDHKLKLFLHSHPVPEWWSFRKRIEGAQAIRQSIVLHGFEHILKVPQKWLYPMPFTDFTEEINPRFFVLVVEDMHISPRLSYVNYYKANITKNTLLALFTVISENLLIDSVFPDNIPRCMDGKIAFVDTEHFMVENSRIRWEKLHQALNGSKRKYLQKLIDEKDK